MSNTKKRVLAWVMTMIMLLGSLQAVYGAPPDSSARAVEYEYTKLPQEPMAASATASSAETSTTYNEGPAAWAFDGNLANAWHTSYSHDSSPKPHWIQWELGGTYQIGRLEYQRKTSANNGNWKTATVEARVGGEWTEVFDGAVGDVTLGPVNIDFAPVAADALKVTIHTATGDGAVNDWFASAGELNVYKATVKPAYVLSVSPAEAVLTVGDTVELTTELTPAAEAAVYTWAVSDEAVVTCENGLATAIGAGTADVTVSTEIEGVTYSASCSITVENPAETGASAKINGGEAVRGDSLKELIANSGVAEADVTAIEFVDGIVTADFFKLDGEGGKYYVVDNLTSLQEFKLNLNENMIFHDKNGASTTTFPGWVFTKMEPGGALTGTPIRTLELGGFTELAGYSFSQSSQLTSVKIDDVKKIGMSAFGDAVSLTEINMPSVTSLSTFVFDEAVNLAKVSMPKIEEIREFAFMNTAYTDIELPATLKSVSYQAFGHRDTVNHTIIETEFHVTMLGTTPPAVKLGYGETAAFKDPAAGSYVTVPEGSEDAYLDSAAGNRENGTWDSLKLRLPEAPVLTAKVNETEFGGSSLEAIVAKSGVAIADLTSLEVVSGNVTQEDLAYLKNLSDLENFTMNLSDTLTLTGKDGNPTTVLSKDTAVLEFAPAKSGSSKADMRKLTLGGFTEIQNGGLIKAASIEKISLPDVVTVGDSAFSACEWLDTLDLQSAKTIGDYAFLYLQRLETVNMNAVETLGVESFEYTDELTKLTLPATLKSMENISFGRTRSGNKSGTVITMKGSVPPTVASGAFTGVNNGTVVVPFGALQAYVSQAYPNADAGKVLATKEAQWNNLYLKEEGTYRIEYNVPSKSWLKQFAYIPVGEAVTADRLAIIKDSDLEAKVMTGWNTKSNGTGDALTAETVLTKDIIVYAVLKDAWVVSFDVEGTVTKAKVVKGEAIGTNLPADPTKEGYVFKGWNTAADGTGTAVTADTVPEANTTVYAIFEEEAAVVVAKIDGNGYDGASLEEVIAKSGVSPSNVESIEFVSGTITPADLSYMKNSVTYLTNLKMNLSATLQLVDAEGNSSTVLPGTAFQNSRLETIEMAGFTEIEGMAFQGATSLYSVSMPDVEVIGKDAFYRTDDYENIVIPASIRVLNSCGFGVAANGTKEIHVVMAGNNPPAEMTGRIFSSASADSDITVPAGSLPNYLPSLDLSKVFGTGGETKFQSLHVIDPQYHFMTYKGKNSWDVKYAYVKAGETVTENRIPTTFKNDPMVLIGWNTKKDGTGTPLTADTVPESDMYVYAIWGEAVTVSFDVDGSTTEVTLVKGEAIGTNLPADPVKEGYVFKGWNTAADGTGDAVTADTVPTANITVYAVFEEIPKDVVTATISNVSGYTGTSIQDAADKAIADQSDLTSYEDIGMIRFDDGIITEQDFAFIKENMPNISMIGIERGTVVYHDAEGNVSTKIPDHAFEGLQKLTIIYFKTSTFKEIGAYAFADTPKLCNVTLSRIEKIGEGAFKVSPDKLSSGVGKWVKFDDVNATIKYIGADAFLGRIYMKNVFVNGAVEIGANAFRNMPELISFNMNNKNLKKIGANAFSLDEPSATKFTLYMPTNFTTLPELEMEGENHPFMNRGVSGVLGNYKSAADPIDAVLRASEHYDAQANTWCGFPLYELPSYTVTADVDGVTEIIKVSPEEGKLGDKMPADPAKEGWRFLGWNTAADGTGREVTAETEITEDITIYAVFARIGYVIKVNGVTQKICPYNTKVVVVAPAPDPDKKFAGWKVNSEDGELISTDSVYTFFAANDMNLIPIYVDNKAEEPKKEAKALLSNLIVTKRADGKSNVKYVGQLVLPEGYTLVNAGLIWTSKPEGEADLIVDGALNMSQKLTYIKTISSSNQFSVTINGMPAGKSMRGVIFATVKDSEGNQILLYSEEAGATAK